MILRLISIKKKGDTRITDFAMQRAIDPYPTLTLTLVYSRRRSQLRLERNRRSRYGLMSTLTFDLMAECNI